MADTKPPRAEGTTGLRGAGPPPHPGFRKLLAYHQNRLGPEAQERLQEHFASCRDCARDAADLARFLRPPGEEDPDEEAERLTAAEAAALWRDLEAKRAAAVAPRADLATLQPPAPPPVVVPWHRRPAVLQAVAVVLLVSTAASVSAWLAARGRLERLAGGEVNVPVETLVTPGFLREGVPSAPGPPEVPPGAVLILTPARVAPDVDHDVEITGADGQVVWSAQGLRPVPPARGFHLRLPFDLPAGATYRIRVAAAGRGPGESGEVFEVRVAAPGAD